MGRVITEVTPLSDKDCFYLVDRTKDSFNFPIHRHEEYELNFVANGRGARRIVGDSIEVIGDYDLCLIGNGIEHVWEQYECQSRHIREITIQFSNSLFNSDLFSRNQFLPIRGLLDLSSKGVCFGSEAIMKVYSRLDYITRMTDGFEQTIVMLSILNELANSPAKRTLSSSSFTTARISSDSRRVQKAQDYIAANYRGDIQLSELASQAGMTATSFSRFFKLRTGRSVSDYIIDIRLGHATRMLMESAMSVAEICYDCGFNNVSNFNRIFKRKKGCTPKEFREIYRRHQTVV